MDLLEKINNCTEEELNSIITIALQSAIQNSEKNKRLGFIDGALATAKIPSHKGFISPDSKIKYNNTSFNLYSMKTTDYIYDFAKYIRKNKACNKSTLIRNIEGFINEYFGFFNGNDIRDSYFDQIAFKTTTTDEEYFDKLENLEIGNLKGKNIAMCTERAAVAQNLLSLFGFEVYYCIGCINNNGKEVPHCFNIVRAKDTFKLLDYSLPVALIENGCEIDYAPFKGNIGLEELEDVLLNEIDKEFHSYEFIKTPQGTIKKDNGETRIYKVGRTTFKQIKPKNR